MRPQTEEHLAQAVRDASGPLVVRGGGTRPVGRPIVGDVLEVGGLSGVRLYEPGALTLVVGAGTTLAEVVAVLAEGRQRLPFEPADYRGLLGTTGESTMGGVVAGNISGPRRLQAGACRDSLIGVRFVDGTGAVVKNGGRVMKNVTGYDLAKLMAGSWGTLGVLTEVSFKLLPAAETAATVVLSGKTLAEGVAVMAAAMGSPYDLSGAAWLPDGRVALRIEGLAASVAYRAGALAAHLSTHGTARVLERDETLALWQGIRDVAPFHGRSGDVWRVSCKPSDAPGLVDRAGGEALCDWAGGLVWLLLPEGTDLRAALGAFDGHATLVRASAATLAAIAPFHPEAPGVAALSRALRQKFDPRGLFNPGLMT